MKTPLQHIENQLCEVNQLSDKENKRWAEGVLQGLCEAYFNMGLINQKEWDEVWKKAEIIELYINHDAKTNLPVSSKPR